MRKTPVLQRGLLIAAMSIMPCGAAVVMFTAPGTLAPPATLGGFNMYGFPTDSRSEFTMTNNAPFWGGDTLGFSEDLEVNETPAPGAWATWSHGYSGTVYADCAATTLTLTFPTDIKAFYMYVEPCLYGNHEFTFSSAGAEVTLMIEGASGAQYIGVYTDDPLGSLGTLLITQNSGTADGFAIGEFASNVQGQGTIPEPAQFAGLGLLLVSGLMLRNRR